MNVRTITSEDLAKYPTFLKGKQVGDVITAQEDYEMRKKAGEDVSVINADTGVTDVPSAVDSDVNGTADGKSKKK